MIALAESKLTKSFPDNLDELDLKIAFNLAEKEIQLKEGALVGAKHRVNLFDIRRVKCVTNGVLSNLFVYTKEKGGFFDKPDMKVPVNELTLPVSDDWHRIAYDHVRCYDSDIFMPDDGGQELERV